MPIEQVVEKLKSAKRLFDLPRNRVEMELALNSDRFVALFFYKKELYNATYAPYRELIIRTGRVAAILQRRENAWLLIAPKQDEPYDPWFMYLGSDLPPVRGKVTFSKFQGHRDLEYSFVADLFVDEDEEGIAKSSAFRRRFYLLKPLRLDYPYYKGISEADAENDTSKLSDVSEFVAGGLHPHQNEYFDTELSDDEILAKELTPIKLLSLSNVNILGGLHGEYRRTYAKRQPTVQALKAGDIVLSIFGGHIYNRELGSMGMAAIFEGDEDNVFATQIMAVVRPNFDLVDPYYLLIALRTKYFGDQLLRFMKPGNRQQGMVSIGDLRNARVRTLAKKNMEAIGMRHKARIQTLRDVCFGMDKDVALADG
jgi:hypothetical protein